MEAHIYTVSPQGETRDGIEMDAADRSDVRERMAAGMGRSGAKILALDSDEGRALRHMTVAELRAERDRLAGLPVAGVSTAGPGRAQAQLVAGRTGR